MHQEVMAVSPDTGRSRVSARIGGIAESATLAVDAKAKALKAAGRPSSGSAPASPTSRPPSAIVEAAAVAVRDPRNHRYTPTAGLPELRAAIATRPSATPASPSPPSQVLVTNGGKHAVYNTFQTLLDPGDEVLLPAPYWTTYPEAITLAGGVAGRPADDRDDGFRVVGRAARGRAHARDQGAAVRARRATRPARCTRRELVEAIGRWAVAHGIWVVTDEIYEHLIYDGHEASSMPWLVPELADTCVVLNGVAKTYAMTGWRVGWMIGPPDVVEGGDEPAVSHLSSNVANVSQRAALAALSGALDAVARDAGRVRPSAAHDRRAARRDPRRAVPGAARRVLLLPRVRGAARQADPGTDAGQQPGARRGGARSSPRSRSCRGRRSARRGYVRLSYALGDDDLRTGISRMADVLGEAS